MAIIYLHQTPGPGAYNVTSPNIYKTAPPNFSMTSRNVMPGDGTQKPGPGAHSPERVSQLELFAHSPERVSQLKFFALSPERVMQFKFSGAIRVT